MASSSKGTIIRVFDTTTGEKLHVVTRGNTQTILYSMEYCLASQLLFVHSEQGTLHVFDISDEKKSVNYEPSVSGWASKSFYTLKMEPLKSQIQFFSRDVIYFF